MRLRRKLGPRLRPQRQDAGAGNANALAQAFHDFGDFGPWGGGFPHCGGQHQSRALIEFLTALIHGKKRKIYLVVDSLRVHHAKRVTEWLAHRKDRLELVFLSPYAPESNPDEYLNRHFKTALRTGAVSHDKETLLH